jgi:RNA polymerase sigma-70 factor (ECF subfamily)
MRDDDNLAGIFMALRGRLARAVQHIVPPKEIEDIVQETYLRIRQVGGNRKIESPRSFMFTTVRNLALDYVKRAETRLADSYDELEDGGLHSEMQAGDSTYGKACSDEEFAQFCDGVRYLPIQCRRAFVLRKVYGYSQKEIAKLMRVSESTVEKHIAEGIKRCLYFMEQRNTNQRRDGKPNEHGAKPSLRGMKGEGR